VVEERSRSIEIPGAGSVTAIESLPETPGEWQFVYAPGAGSNVHDPFGSFACRELASLGVRSIRFQFPYQEAGKKSPDRTPVLEATWRALIEDAHNRAERLVVGGRSMGGRIASQVVSADGTAEALALLAYPLHPPGKPEQRRDAHLGAIRIPALFCSGTRDAFASVSELEDTVKLLQRGTLHTMEDADHSFSVPKASGRTREDIWREAVDAMWEWIREL
jgi:predicted alpha/beta-hydrolase family hydrolase